MWHCSALFFLRCFHGLSEPALWKDPLHLLLQPANYNTVIKRTLKQLPSYISVWQAKSDFKTYLTPLLTQEGGDLVLAHLVWLLPEDTENPQHCLSCNSVKNIHTSMHTNESKSLWVPSEVPETGNGSERPKYSGCPICPLKDCLFLNCSFWFLHLCLDSRSQQYPGCSLIWFFVSFVVGVPNLLFSITTIVLSSFLIAFQPQGETNLRSDFAW